MDSLIARRRLPSKGSRHVKSKGEVIHSGHFMISSVADQDDLEDEVSHDRDSPNHFDQAMRLREGYDFSGVSKETQNTYQFGHRSTNQITIDASLSRLFECMSLAYRGGKVVSPKWKNFKGLRLTVKDKIRLNNAIWRTWHIQYIMKKKRNGISFVKFATPLDNEFDCDSHSRPEAVVMEGKYWKRRIETVVAEYKKWRGFFMDKLQQSDRPGLTWVSNPSMPPTPESISGSLDAMLRGDDSMFSDLSDKLFRGLSQPFQFPNPREIAQHATNSDMMQPGLLQLQPPMDDFMDPLDLDIFSPLRKSPMLPNNVSLFHGDNNNVNHSIAQLDFPTPLFTQEDFDCHPIQESSLEELVQRATNVHQEHVVMSMANDVMRMQAEKNQTITPAQMPVQNNNFHVQTPVMNSELSTGMNYAPVQDNVQSTSGQMMVSKQQQETPTISQVVMSSPHHQYPHVNQQSNFPMIDNLPKKVMPPPKKAPPRRKSISRTFQSGNAPVQNHINFQTANVPMATDYAAPQTKLSNVQMGMSQMMEVPVPTQYMNQGMPQQMQMQVEQSQQIIPGIAASQQIASGNDVQSNNHILSKPIQPIKDQSVAQIQVFVPSSVQQHDQRNQYVFTNTGQPPLKKQHLTVPPVVVKQSQTMQNSQPISAKHQTLLTQLLTTERRGSNGSSNLLSVPASNVSNNSQSKEQLKQISEQALRLNEFQNTVVFLAAEATAPNQHQTSPQTTIHRTGVNEQNQITSTKPFVIYEERSQKKISAKVNDKGGRKSEPSSPWPLSAPSSVSSMDTDDGRSREDFVSEMEEKTFSASTSPASSIPDQKTHHFTAEQKRRCNIKSLFDRLQDILPELSTTPNPRISKAVLLSKSCNYITTLKQQRQQTANEIQVLKRRIEDLNGNICNFQQQLPSTGAPVSRHRGERMRAVFDDWVRERTLNEWKFFIFSMIIRPWFSSYNETVSTSSVDEFCRSSLTWVEKHCSMSSLRRGVVNSLQELGTTTSILTDPGNLQQQAESAVQHPSRCCSNQSS